MRLLFFSSMGGSPWGGSEELWADAARRAVAAGHEVAVSVFDFGEPVRHVAALERAGARLILRPRRLSWAAKAAALVSEPEWLRAIGRWGPQAVCLSQGSAYECVGRRSTRAFSDWLARGEEPYVNVVQFNEPKDDLTAGTLSRSRRLYGGASCNAFVAARNITEAAATLGGPVPRARVVRNPVNLARADPLAWPEEGGMRLACVARLHVDAKGQDMLLEALAARPWRGEDWTLSLYGAGQDEGRLKEQASRLGLAEKVRFMGQTSDIRGVWAEHHLLVLSSRAEGTPLAMVEAMILARPCLVTDVGGCADWVVDGENGFLAAPTVEGLGAALDRARAARGRWPELARAARATAERLHDPEPGRTLLGLVESAARPARG